MSFQLSHINTENRPSGWLTLPFKPFSAKCGQGQNSTKIPKFRFAKFWKQIAPFESTSREVSFKWSHHRILSTDSKVRTTLRDSNIHSGSERVKRKGNFGDVSERLLGNREFTQRRRRRRRQQERQKSNRFRQGKQQLCTRLTLFCTSHCRLCRTTTWNCLL